MFVDIFASVIVFTAAASDSPERMIGDPFEAWLKIDSAAVSDHTERTIGNYFEAFL